MLSWRLLALTAVACLLAGALAGWRVTTWAYGYGEQRQLEHREKALGNGIVAVTKFNAQWSKYHAKPTDCFNQPVPSALLKQLR